MSKFDNKLKQMTNLVLEMAYGVGPNAQPITTLQLGARLAEIETGDTEVKFTSITSAHKRKKHPETGERIMNVFKVSQVSGKVKVNYQERMTNIGREGGGLGPEEQHILQQTYFIHVGGAIVEHRHNHKQYMQVIPEDTLNPQYVIQNNAGALRYATKEMVLPFIETTGEARPVEYVVIRNYQLSAIAAIELDGVDYKVTDIEPIKQQVLDIVDTNPNRPNARRAGAAGGNAEENE